MSALAAIQNRYGFEFPATYRALLEKGCFSPTPWEHYLELSDCEWLSLEQIAAYQFHSFQITSDGGFVPFATSARGDEYCWRLSWAEGREPPVVVCERGESGFGYAPHFQGFLYRKVIEEFAGFGGIEQERDTRRLRRVVAGIAPHLPSAWAERLQGLAERPWSDWQRGRFGELLLVSREQLAAALSEWSFPYLDQKFIQDKELLKRRAQS